MLNRMGVICLWVHDFAQMVAFYRDILGLPLSGVHPGAGYTPGSDWIQFELQGVSLELFDLTRSPQRAGRLPSPRANASILCFRVDDFDATYQLLASHGVAFQPVGEQEWGRYAHFRDPEGNELQIYQPNPGY
jgi:catechol 2,3-dioxygenase-like lactoylglutathione lyase family enzyme